MVVGTAPNYGNSSLLPAVDPLTLGRRGSKTQRLHLEPIKGSSPEPPKKSLFQTSAASSPLATRYEELYELLGAKEASAIARAGLSVDAMVKGLQRWLEASSQKAKVRFAHVEEMLKQAAIAADRDPAGWETGITRDDFVRELRRRATMVGGNCAFVESSDSDDGSSEDPSDDDAIPSAVKKTAKTQNKLEHGSPCDAVLTAWFRDAERVVAEALEREKAAKAARDEKAVALKAVKFPVKKHVKSEREFKKRTAVKDKGFVASNDAALRRQKLQREDDADLAEAFQLIDQVPNAPCFLSHLPGLLV